MINSFDFKKKKEISFHKKYIEDNLEYINSIKRQENLRIISKEEVETRIKACHDAIRWHQHKILRIGKFYD